MNCPFCEAPMHRGSVQVHGWYSSAVTAVFVSDDDSKAGSKVVGPNGFLFRRDRRPAHCCADCEAVVVDPKVHKPPPFEYGAGEVD